MTGRSESGLTNNTPVDRVEIVTRADRFDRRFSIDGDPFEALKVVLADNSAKMF